MTSARKQSTERSLTNSTSDEHGYSLVEHAPELAAVIPAERVSSETETIIRHREVFLRELEERIAILEAGTREREEIAFARDAAIRERENIASARDAAIRERENIASARDAAIRERENIIKQRQEFLRELEQRIVNLEVVVREREAVARERDAAIREREDILRLREEIIKQREDTIARLDTVIEERTSDLTMLRAALTRKRSEASKAGSASSDSSSRAPEQRSRAARMDRFLKARRSGRAGQASSRASRDDAARIASSGLFDAEWYLDLNPEVRSAGLDPILHYLEIGARNRVSPHPLFDTDWYLNAKPDVLASGVNPLLHYLDHGAKQGLDPNPHFHTNWYLDQNPDVHASGENPLAHYLAKGAKEGRNPNPSFDVRWYLEQNPDARDLALDPLVHYLTVGLRQGREPNAAVRETIRRRRADALGLGRELRPVHVAIGIVTYNNDARELGRCLDSVGIAFDQAGFAEQGSILVIDNGEATDPSLLERKLVRRVPSQGNIGFGAGHNRLMEAAFEAGADYYVATNPDGAFEPSSLEALVRMVQAADDKALVEGLQFPEEHPKAYDPGNFDTPWASGACLLVPRAIFQTIGGFDERFFMYCEDVDLSWRARAAGLAVKICPRALFFHPVTARAFDPAIHARFLTSGLSLARKWGAPSFEKKIVAEFAKLKLPIPDLPPAPLFEGRRDVADFDHMFSFAKTRW